MKETLGLPSSQCALAIFDVFAVHRSKSVLEVLEKHSIKCVIVPTGCTGELQPLDLAFNDPFKQEMKDCFMRWHASTVKNELEQ